MAAICVTMLICSVIIGAFIIAAANIIKGNKQRMASNLFGLILIVVVGVYDFVNELRKYEQGV